MKDAIETTRGSHGDVIERSFPAIKIEPCWQPSSFSSTPKFDTKKPVHRVHPTPKPTSSFPQCLTPPPPLSTRTACLRLRKRRSKRPPASRYALSFRIDVAHAHQPRPPNTRQVFVGNLAYSTTDEGLKAFFAPVQEDMYVQDRLLAIRRPNLALSPVSQPRSFTEEHARLAMGSSP